MDHTARLDLPYIMAGQALKHITHNESLERLDLLVQPFVESASLVTPPASPLAGEAYLVPEGAAGDWAGHDNEIAAFQAGSWTFYDPAAGWQVYDRASGTLRLFSGTAWVPVAAVDAGLPRLGVNASADATNRLAVAADASLFTHDGADHHLKVNKAASGDTASVLFQNGWSGRAEMGLIGDENWRIKVSPDGAGWTDALIIDAASAEAVFGGPVLPSADNAQTLGASGARWSAVWSATGTIQTSDRASKRDIAPSDLGLDFILALEPVRFRWREDDGRIHYGLIAQQVAEAAEMSGIGNFGGHVVAGSGKADAAQALRYDQFIAPLIAALHTLTRRIAALEDTRSP